MPTMKKVWKYLLNFIVLYAIVSLLTWWGINLYSKKKKKETEQQNTTIETTNSVKQDVENTGV